MSDKGWTTRLTELGLYRPTGLAWDRDVWPLMAYAERTKGTVWLQEHLWRLKFASWILHLDQQRPQGHQDSRGRLTCNACGAKIPEAHRLSRYCTTACRKVAHRRRQTGEPTEWEAQVARATTDLAHVKNQMRRAHRWWKNQHRGGEPPAVSPPDLTRIDHLPWTPRRCGGGCTATAVCIHTKALCLFTATAASDGTDDEETR